MLASGRFYYGAEVVTTRGLEPVDPPGNLAAFARDLLADPRIGWISITDNPGGGPMLPPDWLGRPGGRPPRPRGPAPDLQGHEPQRPGSRRLALRLARASTTSWPSPATIRPAASAAWPSRCSTSTRSA